MLNFGPRVRVPPLAGRHAELSWLRGLWDEATTPGHVAPRMAVLVAETGLGKSRIVQEFYRQLAADPAWNDGYWPDAFTDGTSAAQVNPDLAGHRPDAPPRFLWLATRWIDLDARNREARRAAITDLRARLALHVRVAIQSAPLWRRTRSAAARMVKEQGLAGGLEQLAQEGVGRLFEAATGGLPFGGLLVTLAKAAPEIVSGPSSPEEYAASASADASDALRGELDEVFGGFGGGGIVLPTALWLDDAQWIDDDTLALLHRVWDRAVERSWPLLVIVTHWEREWRLLGSGDEDARARSLRRYDGLPGVSVRLVEPASDADLGAVLDASLPGLTVAQRQLMLSRAGGNFLTLVENVGELLAQQASFAGRDVRGPLSRAGERRVTDWESDRERRVRQRFAALDEQLRDLLGWSSHGGQRFLHAVLARFLAAREGRPDADARTALEPCIDPLAILAEPSPAFFEFRDVALHRAAREHFDLYLADDDEPALAAALRSTLSEGVNACFDAVGAFVEWRREFLSPEDQEPVTIGEDPPLLYTLDDLTRQEILSRAVRELPLDDETWVDARRAALRARLWLMRVHARDGLWRELARLAAPLASLHAAALAPGVVSPALLLDAGWHARLAGEMLAADRLFDVALALVPADNVGGSRVHAEALEARGKMLAEQDPAAGARLLEQALAIAEAVGPDAVDLIVDLKLALGGVCEQLGDVGRAERLSRDALDLQRLRLTAEDPRLSRPLGRLGTLLARTGRVGEAEPLLEESLAIQRKWADLADTMPATWQVDIVPALSDLAELREQQGRLGDAETLLREALEASRRFADDPRLLYPLWRLGAFLATHGRRDEAVVLLTESSELARRLLGPGHPRTVAHERALAEVAAGRLPWA
jgi:tetratricopeptide (TPR) repeat protein